MPSIFTKIINKELDSDIVYENDKVIVIKDIAPRAKTHLLIIPKKEIPTINDIKCDDKDLVWEMFEIAKKLLKICEFLKGINYYLMYEKKGDKKLCIYICIYWVICSTLQYLMYLYE